MDVRIHPTWKTLLQDTFESDAFAHTAAFVKQAYQQGTVYPPPSQIFAAFDACPVDQVKVVIIGQDPYHGPGQANGLCFSVAPGVRIPPSLQNIYKEIQSDIGTPIPDSGDLSRWAEQGVLLLNATLTVGARSPGSHQGKGWEEFTDAVIERLSEHTEGLVFLLWGAYAQRKGAQIDRQKHLVLSSPHPSPFSAHKGFFGNKHFSQTNDYLQSQGNHPIEW